MPSKPDPSTRRPGQESAGTNMHNPKFYPIFIKKPPLINDKAADR